MDKNDAVIRPACVRLSEGVTVTFEVETYGELQRLAAKGSTRRMIDALFAISDDPELLHDLTPVEGFWLLKHVLPVVVKAARKYTAVARSYEVALNDRFDDDTPLDVLGSLQADYQKIFKKRSDAAKKNAR